jgi:expansin
MVLILLLLLFYSISFCVVDDGSILHSGKATFYGDGGGGNCGFPGEEQPLYHGAMNQIDYDSSRVCGAWVHITGPSGEVTAFIDDRCPECLEGDIDLGPGTFEKIADRKLGIAPISWRYVEAPVIGPIYYHWQSGTSIYHIALQIRNYRYAITTVEIKTSTSEWKMLTREFYNYFILPGGVNNADSGPYILRVTDIFQRQIVDSGLAILPDQTVPGSSNFDPINQSIINKAIPATNTMIKKHFFTSIGGIIPIRYNSDGLYNVYTILGKKIGSMNSFLELNAFLRQSSFIGVVAVSFKPRSRDP